MTVDINKVAKILKKDFGSAHVAGEKEDSNELVSTGNKSLDLALNGGIAWGSAFEFAGKSGCFGKGTKVMLYDGSIKKVEDVKVGDQLMGDDSTPRNVLSLCRGAEELYEVEIITTRYKRHRKKYIFNKSHILSLRGTYDGLLDIPLMAYKDLNKTRRDHFKFYRKEVEFDKKFEKKLLIDPYILGLWLGDGNSDGTGYTSKDKKLIDLFETYLNSIGCIFNEQIRYTYRISRDKTKHTQNNFLKKLDKYNLRNNKHIPKNYLLSNKHNRLELLAGLIDSDGHMNGNINYDIVQKSEKLAKNIVFLARSLGMHTTPTQELKYCYYGGKKVGGKYWRVYIGKNSWQIPTRLKYKRQIEKALNRKPNLNYGIYGINSIGVGDYYGFELDGNHRFLDSDFTVLHNTGKTTMLQSTLAKAQNDYDAIGIWIDREKAWYNERAEQLGVNLDKVIKAEPIDVPIVPDATKFIKTSLENIYSQDPNQYVMIVIDSISSFMPTVDIGKADMGNVAKHIHALFRVCLPNITNKVLLGYVLHITYKTGVAFGNPLTTTSGEAPKYYANYRMQLTDKRQIVDSNKGNEVLGNWIEAEVIKTRRGAGHRIAKIPLLYKEGIPYYGGYTRLLCDRNYLAPKNKAEFNKFLQTTVVDSDGNQFHEDDVKKIFEKHPELDFNEYPEYKE